MTGRDRPRRRQRQVGFTLLEVLVTVAMIAAMVGTALVQYSMMLESRQEGKAHTELIQIVKALKTFSEKTGWPDTPRPNYDTPWTNPAVFYLHDFTGLFKQKIMLNNADYLPQDPWGNDYWLDITRGVVASAGPPPGVAMQDYAIVERFRPLFVAQTVAYDGHANQITIDFTRAVNHSTATTQTITVAGAGPSMPTTALMDQANPYRIRMPLNPPPPVNGTVLTITLAKSIQAMDITTLGAYSTPQQMAFAVTVKQQ